MALGDYKAPAKIQAENSDKATLKKKWAGLSTAQKIEELAKILKVV